MFLVSNQSRVALTLMGALCVSLALACDERSAGQELNDASMPVSDSGPEDSGLSDSERGSGDSSTVFPDAQVTPARTECDQAHTPLVMVHGFLASSDTWAGHVQRFTANGYCVDRFHPFDWNTLDRNVDHLGTLDRFIDDVLVLHGVDQVDLMGHSAGGGLGFSYLEDSARVLKVRRYAHIGSFPSEGPAGTEEVSVPTLNLWSPDDLAVEGADIPGANNVQLAGDDHYAVATSERSFRALYEFLKGDSPDRVEPRSENQPIVGGRIVTLGENRIEDGGQVEVYALESDSPERARPVRRFDVGEDGRWGPFVANPDTRYEFLGIPGDSASPAVRYFREAFAADQPLVYLRTLPGPGSIASILVSLLPLDGDSVPLVIYNARSAFLVGRDSLTLDGVELLTEASASAENTSIALFVFDVNNDGEAGANSPLFDMFPFLAAIDLPIESAPDRSMSLVFNGRTILLPRDRPSSGIVIAVFD